MYTRISLQKSAAIPVQENLWMLRPHLSRQTRIPLSGLSDIRHRRQNALGMARICGQTEVTSFTSTGNLPKEVKAAHWRSRINLQTMHLASQRTRSSLWRGVVVWNYGPRNLNYHMKKDTDWRAHECRRWIHCWKLESRWRLPTVKAKQKAQCELGSQRLLPLHKNQPGKQWLLAEVGSPALAGLSPR